MPSKSKSLVYAVRNDESVVRASAARAGRTKSADSRQVNSVAKCWQSAALPPFPHKSSLPPLWKELAIRSAASRIAREHSSNASHIVLAAAERCVRTENRRGSVIGDMRNTPVWPASGTLGWAGL